MSDTNKTIDGTPENISDLKRKAAGKAQQAAHNAEAVESQGYADLYSEEQATASTKKAEKDSVVSLYQTDKTEKTPNDKVIEMVNNAGDVLELSQQDVAGVAQKNVVQGSTSTQPNASNDSDLINDDIAGSAQTAIKQDVGFSEGIEQQELSQTHTTDLQEQVRDHQAPDSHEETTEKMWDMQTDAPMQNAIASAQTETSKDIEAQVKRELPDTIKNQYLVNEKEDKFFDKGQRQKLAFEVVADKSIKTPLNDSKTVSSMLLVAESKGWKSITLNGEKDFKREAWLQSTMRGIEVRGYSPSKEDKELLSARVQAQQKNAISQAPDKDKSDAMAKVKVAAEAAIKEKVRNPAAQEKVRAAINQRAADAIEHGKAPKVAVYDHKEQSRNLPVQIQAQDTTKERSR